MTEDYVIQLNNVRKTFPLKKNTTSEDSSQNFHNDSIVVLDNISFSVSKGEIIGILGLNGSGKTTLLRVISGIYQPNSGSVEVKGSMAPLLQIGIGFHEELNAKDNIMAYGMLLGLEKNEVKNRIDKIIDFAELEEFSNMSLKYYSSGMKVRLAFSIALEMNPDIFLIDEVLAVGDIKFKEKSFQSILSYKNQGKTILFTTHNLSMISQLASRAIILDKGKIKKIGMPKDIITTYKEFGKKN